MAIREIVFECHIGLEVIYRVMELIRKCGEYGDGDVRQAFYI